MTIGNRHEAHEHPHTHGANCGHVAILHAGHVDYLHDGHLHHPHGDHSDEHSLAVDAEHPDACKPMACVHAHAPDCGHPRVPHGNHVDFLVDGRLHHQHDDHCDDHGPVKSP